MTKRTRKFARRCACLAGLLVAAALAGCDRAEIRTYRAPKGGAEADGQTPGATSGARSGPARPAWSVPEGWQRLERSGRMRVAAFRAGTGADAPTVTVTALPGRAGGVSANVNRWRRQLGLEPVRGEDLRSAIDPLGAGGAGVVADIENEDGQRILGVILTDAPERSWFVKVRAGAPAVGRIKSSVLAFARSFAWPEGGGSS